jgi:NADH:ubiquinone oxidoreductase subunit 6 (subunit J)
LGLIYLCTFLSIYNTENAYYLVLYTIFLIFIFSITLVLQDLDIFAGLLLLIECVVILMFFFLIIYITPNVSNNKKIHNWRIVATILLIIALLSLFSYSNLGENYITAFLTSGYFLDDFYEAMSEVVTNDLTGLYITLY